MTELATPEPSYDITPEDAHYVAQIEAISMEDVRGPHEWPAEDRRLAPLQITALPPEHQKEVHARLAGLSPDEAKARESDTVAAVIRERISPMNRIKGGVHADTLPFHREMNAVRFEVYDTDRKIDRLTEELAEVARYEVRTDPVTGLPKPVPIMKLEGARQQAALNERDMLLRKMDTLADADGKLGHEAFNRLRKAKHETVQILKARDTELSDWAETKALAEKMVRDERLNKNATSLANMRRNGASR